ncbi:hypothetical protein P3W45_001342 [Vairimorpha bombi]|jgi:hypothetical protein
MDDTGEIEYFEFVPINFVNELEAEIHETINTEFKYAKRISTVLHESCKKNMFIFKNFVLRNILKFPSKFSYERKCTDLVVDSIPDIDKYYKVVCRQDDLKDKMDLLSANIRRLKNKCTDLSCILEYENDVYESGKNIKNVRNTYNMIMEYVSTLPFYEIDEDNFNYLLEYREIRSEILKKKLDNINERIDLDLL